jgi:thiol-disulfide isomerase/thioredoxin
LRRRPRSRMKRIVAGLIVWTAVATAMNAWAAQILEGQIVCCADCWAEADRAKVEYGTSEDLAKAAACVAGGDPTLLAVRAGSGFELYRLEQGRFEPPGKDWLELVGSRVRVTGRTVDDAKTKSVRVDALEVLTPSIAVRNAGAVIGQRIDLTLKDLSGAQQSLAALAGRIVILNFWATYCAPCRIEMPDLTAIQNAYGALGVQVVGAAADTAEDKPKVLNFVRDTKINFPVWLGASAADMQRFGLTGALPGTVIIGKDGKIAKVMAGAVQQSQLAAQIDAMLAAADATSGAAEPESAESGDEVADSAEVSSVPS